MDTGQVIGAEEIEIEGTMFSTIGEQYFEYLSINDYHSYDQEPICPVCHEYIMRVVEVESTPVEHTGKEKRLKCSNPECESHN